MSAVTVLYPISIELVGYNGEQLALWQKFFAFSLRQKCCGINSVKQSGLLKISLFIRWMYVWRMVGGGKRCV